MGTKLIQQRRGKGSPTFKAPSHKFFADARYEFPQQETRGQVVRFVDDPARHAILAEILLENGSKIFLIAAEGLKKNDVITLRGTQVAVGNVLELANVPDGTPVFNVERKPGDGGRIARSSGASAYVIAHDEETGLVSLHLSSKETVSFDPRCLATIGIACGGGRVEKPFKKAGARYYALKARNKYYPRVRGTAMSAYDHPHGGKSFGKSTTVSKSTPPGRKVGQLAARVTGRKKGRAAKTIESAA